MAIGTRAAPRQCNRLATAQPAPPAPAGHYATTPLTNCDGCPYSIRTPLAASHENFISEATTCAGEISPAMPCDDFEGPESADDTRHLHHHALLQRRGPFAGQRRQHTGPDVPGLGTDNRRRRIRCRHSAVAAGAASPPDP